MKMNLSPLRSLTLTAILFFIVNVSIAQRDTIHLYYYGAEVRVLDSNDVKIDNWVKWLKGRKSDIEIQAYYDNSSMKKMFAERAENVQMVVIRKARDFVNIQSYGPVKGTKADRNRVDIIYSRPPVPAEENTSEESKSGN